MTDINRPTLGVVVERLENLRCDVGQLDQNLTKLIELTQRNAERIILVEQAVSTAHQRIDKLTAWRDEMERLMPVLKSMAWAVTVWAPVILVGLAIYLWNLWNHTI